MYQVSWRGCHISTPRTADINHSLKRVLLEGDLKDCEELVNVTILFCAQKYYDQKYARELARMCKINNGFPDNFF